MGGNTHLDQVLFPDVFGISGRKRHGKDTLAKFLIREREHFTVVHFAGELKRQAGLVFGMTHEQLDGSQKETLLPEPIEMDKYLDAMSQAAGLDIQPAGLVAKSPREIMQYLGTEYVRRAKDSYWIDVVLKKIAECGGNVLVPDTRFPNEAEALRSVGGKVIKVQRLDLPETHDAHPSETEMEKIDPDLWLGTMTDNFGLQSRVSKLISEGNFSFAQKFDYRKVSRALAEFNGGANTRDVSDLLGIPTLEAEFVLDYYKVNCTDCLGYRYHDADGNVWRGQVTEELKACGLCNLNAEANRLS